MAYLRRFLLTFFGLLGVVAALNAFMDATGVLGMPVIAGINDAKAPGKDRFFKPLEVELRQPRTLFIGTSRVAVGFDPHDLPGAGAYNLGLLGSTVPEHIAFSRYAVDYAPVDRLLFGLDCASFGDFNRYFLHAASLRFDHPLTGEPMEFHSPLPSELQKLLESLKS